MTWWAMAAAPPGRGEREQGGGKDRVREGWGEGPRLRPCSDIQRDRQARISHGGKLLLLMSKSGLLLGTNQLGKCVSGTH